MTTKDSYFSHGLPQSLRMIPVCILAGCALLLGLRVPINYPKTFAPSNPLPDLQGQAAVERLKQEGLYDTLAEAVTAARYNADALPSPDTYQFSNLAHGLLATFTSSGARIVSSKGGRDLELTFKLIGYGYGSRMTGLDSQNIVARQNRIEHEYSHSAIPESQSAIKEWFVNNEAGIEHGFTLPEPPAERGGDEALRLELEIGGDFEPRLDATGQTVSFACGRGGGELTYNKLRVYDARERELAARFELEGKRLAIVVEDGEAEYPVTIDPLFAQQAKLTAIGGAAFDNFGFSVAISGDTMVVGAPLTNIDDGIEQGAAYIFVRDPTTTPPSWTEQAKLMAEDGASFDNFGFSVAIDGNTVVVGAPFATINGKTDQGAAYIFVRDATTTPPSWTEQAKLTAKEGEALDDFGTSVAIDGDTVVVGEPKDFFSIFHRGAAYIFVRSTTTTSPSWTQQAKLMNITGEEFDKFGFSVAIDGNTAVVGARTIFVGGNPNQGAAFIFVRSGTMWSEQAKLTARDGEAEDNFGFSVAISGDTVVVGAPVLRISPIQFQGKAYFFLRSGTMWSEQQKITATDGAAGDQFGVSVAINGDTVVVGAPGIKIGANQFQGAAYFFLRNGMTWSEQQKLTASDGAAADQFGVSVAINGDTVAVGANGDDSARGAAYVFISCPEIIINPTDRDLTEGTVGQPYIQAFSASAGIAPLSFTVITGSLPPGLTLASDGTLSGAPTSSGTFNFTVQATDAKGCTGERDYTLVINDSTCPTITVNPGTLLVGTPGLAYNQTLTASGGTSPLSFSVLSGSPPPGLMLSTTGILSGTPTAAGVFNLTVLATDSTGCAGARAYTLAIAPSGFATVSAASFEFSVTAKEIVAGFGVSLANKIVFPNSPQLPTSLGGTRVRVKDSAGIERAAALYYVAPSQINYQIPAGTALGPATVLVFVDNALVAAGPAQIVETAPSIFTLRADGSGPAAAQDAITFQPAPFNAKQANGSPNFIAVYGTGLGADATDGGGNISAEVEALIDGKSVMVTYAGQAPGLVGANQFNIQFPDDIKSGDHTLTISRRGMPSNPVMIAIK